MFRHQGKNRTLMHNLLIAIVLSFVAGIVSISGFLSFNQLTTNVTGHFILVTNDIAGAQFWSGIIYLLYIFSFLLGSFSSSILIDKFRENKKINIFVLPTTIESLILISIGISSNFIEIKNPDLIVCLLLFAMGLQNSFVTKISNAVVRTTHLTGLLTDLGIDISHLFFPKMHPHRKGLKANIKLRIYIISFFLAGGIAGGLLYSNANLRLNTLILGGFILLMSLLYDDYRYKKLLKIRRKYK